MDTEPDPREMLQAFRRYDAAFGTLPPLAAWHGSDAALLPLLNAAIRGGLPLRETDFAPAQSPTDQPAHDPKA